jgi:hypothetical protein
MRIEHEETIDGEIVEVMVPENAADRRILEERAKQKLVEPIGGFADRRGGDTKSDFLELGD